MSEARPDICDGVDALLDEVAALDMALLRHVNRVALATEDPDVLNGLVRSQQRLARSIRTTLTTKARLRREADAAARAAREPAPMAYGPRREPPPPHPDQDAVEDAVEARVRLEYDPAEAEEIDPDIGLFAEDACKDPGLETLEARVEAALDGIRKSFGAPGAFIPHGRRMQAAYARLRAQYAWSRPPPDG